MLYRFKSKATADLLLLEPQARLILKTMGKSDDARGIIQVADMLACIGALEEAIAREALEITQNKADPNPAERHESMIHARMNGQDSDEASANILFKHRALPMLSMLRQCLAEQSPIVWGV